MKSLKTVAKLFANGRPIPDNKSSPDYKYYVSSCLSKVAHKNLVEAMKAGLLLGYETKHHVQAYKCEFCGKWHITHKRRDSSNPDNHCIDITGSNGRPWGSSKHTELLLNLFGKMRSLQKKGKIHHGKV